MIAQANLTSLSPNSPGDGYGHGTFVAGIAAGSAPGYAGAAPKANLVSIDVMNDQGQANVTDVIKACDYILANKTKYNIKVANFSLHSVNRASVLFDPLDQAVEKLWLSGVVVVAASGNYGTAGKASGVNFAPGNDPFVITVGAADIGTSVKAGDDTVAPWSAYGYTPDGFSKPDVGAPGRYMVGPVPVGSVLTQIKAANVVSPGYMQLSGTSFAAPIVSAAAAMMVAKHPDWSPDQIKGALMVTATPELATAPGSLGVGDVDLAKLRTYAKTPPNPNAGLNQFVKTAADGTRVFDPSAWQAAASATRRGTQRPGLTRPGRMQPGRAWHGQVPPGPTWHGPPRPGAPSPGATRPGATPHGATWHGRTAPERTRVIPTRPMRRSPTRTRLSRPSASTRPTSGWHHSARPPPDCCRNSRPVYPESQAGPLTGPAFLGRFVAAMRSRWSERGMPRGCLAPTMQAWLCGQQSLCARRRCDERSPRDAAGRDDPRPAAGVRVGCSERPAARRADLPRVISRSPRSLPPASSTSAFRRCTTTG